MVKKFRTTSTGGEPLEVVVTSDTITAYHIKKRELTVIGKEKGKPERDLEEALFREPAMTIRKWDSKYSVDFEAGFQRGSISGLSKKDVFEHIKKIEMYRGEDITGKPFIEWIGLSLDDPKHKSALREFMGEKSRSTRKLKRMV